MRTLEPLLAHPEVPQVDVCVVPGSAGTDDDHSAVVDEKNRSGNGGFARVLKDDLRAAAFAEDFPELRAEGACALHPLPERLGIVDVGQATPVVEVLAVDYALRPQLKAELVLVLLGDDGD